MKDYIDPEHAFTTADALRQGFTRRDIDNEFFERPFDGLRAVRAPDSVEDSTAVELQRTAIERAALRFSAYMATHEFFSHTSAAVLWGIPLPLLSSAAIHVSVVAPHRAPRGAGVRGHQLAKHGVDVEEHPEFGVRITSAASTWAMLGVLLRHPYDLIAAADAIVWIDRVAGPHGRVKRPALASLADLESAIPHKRKGVVALREALPRVREGAASRPETWLRLTLVDAGLPEPDTDVEVFDHAGGFIGCVDLAYRGQKIAIEYEGDHHRTQRGQWNRDIEKHDALVRAGWRVIRVTASMLFVEPSTVVASARGALSERR